MAKMIPPILHPSIKSNAERKIFDILKNTQGTDEWIVLHSLALTSVKNKLYGEIDFILLIPYKGIFVLEVKGGRVKREKGVWLFKNRFGEVTQKTEGPFEQVKNATFSLINEIKFRRDQLHQNIDHIFFSWGVMFPDIKFNAESPEFHNWQVYDASTSSIKYFIDRLFQETQKKWNNTYQTKSKSKLPTPEEIEYISYLLRPDFDQKIALDNQINEIENKLIQLTEEQYVRLTEIEDNYRVILNGSAGTGKTLLAIEAASRFKSDGLKVAFFCYNRNLADLINNYYDTTNPKVKPDVISTIHSRMIKDLTNKGKINTKFDTRKLFQDPLFYSEYLPVLIDQIEEFDDQFDVIIIDEAQDILFKGVIDYINKILINGLMDGRWYFFGDFTNQTIYRETNTEEIYNLLDQYAYYSKHRLTINCRNTVEIYNAFKMYSQININDKVLGVQGIPIEFIYFNSCKNASIKLSQKISELLHQDVPDHKITILSPYKFENSVASSINVRISQNPGDKNSIKFSTVYAYKGLENSVVILVDITDSIDSKLLYVGMSRAKSNLIILANENLRQTFDSRAKEFLLNE